MDTADDTWTPRWRWGLALVGVLSLGTWLGWLDSHSILKRLRWHRTVQQVQVENDSLRHRIRRLERTLNTDLSDREVERIAREEYGMHRPGETIYRVRPAPSSP